jgi:hypothetical protein
MTAELIISIIANGFNIDPELATIHELASNILTKQLEHKHYISQDTCTDTCASKCTVDHGRSRRAELIRDIAVMIHNRVDLESEGESEGDPEEAAWASALYLSEMIDTKMSVKVPVQVPVQVQRCAYYIA